MSLAMLGQERQRAVQIVGGGLAGLSLGLLLRERGISVRIWEAGHYPRHRVCGEFVSGAGVQLLCRWLPGLRLTPAEAHTAQFFLPHRASPQRRLPTAALCISRFELDAALAQAFRLQGGQLEEGKRWRPSPGRAEAVLATGRRAHPLDGRWRWLGLKAHARGVRLVADLEMHVVPGGYVGLVCLRDGEVNVCGLFRRRTHEGGLKGTWKEALSGAPRTILNERLKRAEWDEASFCAVAGLGGFKFTPSPLNECRLGDALGMMAPISGNGMSMALESALLAAAPLTAFSRGILSWTEASRRVEAACYGQFSWRMCWARWVQGVILGRAFGGGWGQILLHCPGVWKALFKLTHS